MNRFAATVALAVIITACGTSPMQTERPSMVAPLVALPDPLQVAPPGATILLDVSGRGTEQIPPFSLVTHGVLEFDCRGPGPISLGGAFIIRSCPSVTSIFGTSMNGVNGRQRWSVVADPSTYWRLYVGRTP
jgi:hypothetical protein